MVILSSVAGIIAAAPSRALARSTASGPSSTPGATPAAKLAHGAMIMLAGVLLLIPGFVTDVVGLLLFIPPVRDVAWRLSKAPGRAAVSSSTGSAARDRGRERSDKTDRSRRRRLSPAADPQSPWRSGDRDETTNFSDPGRG